MDARRKYDYNENFFENINITNSYWIGFIMGDGYLSDHGLRIRLNHKDVEHLKLLNEYMESNMKINIVKNGGPYKGCEDLCEITFNNKKIKKDLTSLGFSFGNKSGNEFIPDEIYNNNDYFFAFVRGLFDADGSIYRLDKTCYTEFTILTSESLVERIKEKLIELKPDIKISKNKKDKRTKINIVDLRLTNKPAVMFMYENLYKDTDLYLKRKKEKFDLIVSKYKR